MNFLKKSFTLSFVAILFLFAGIEASAQDRQRVVRTGSSQPTNQPPPRTLTTTQPTTRTLSSSAPTNRPTLTNDINVQPAPPLIKRTGDASPLNHMATTAAARRSVYAPMVTSDIMKGIEARMGIRYVYGASGPNAYDCSGFIWSVFRDAGLDFERTSARSLWQMSIPVTGDERFVFGTLVFMNQLGHIGIVADENGFYHASRSKGITYSPFKGYWENRIVGYRRLVDFENPDVAR